MTVKSEQLFTQASPTSVAGKVLQFPLVRILAATLSLVPATLLRPGYKHFIAPSLSESVEVMVSHAERVLGILLFIVFYRLYTRIVEKRQAHEMSSKGALKEFGQGVLTGGAIMSTVILIMAVAGYYSIDGFASDWTVALHTIIPFGIAAFAEELLFRIIFFKLTEELVGSWVALILQEAFFGFAHIGNPNASVWAAVAIALEDSVLLAAAFMYTRRIWLIFGIHIAWNYFQSTVFGLATSGHPGDGLITPTIEGPEWITGGSFGPEASPITVVLCLSLGVFLAVKAFKKGQAVMPLWRRKVTVAGGDA